MSAEYTIRMLMGRGRGGHAPLDAAEWKRLKARVIWVTETVAAWTEAQRQMDERCMAAVDRVPEHEFNRIVAEEQAKVDAIVDQLNAVEDEDLWPRELYFGGI